MGGKASKTEDQAARKSPDASGMQESQGRVAQAETREAAEDVRPSSTRSGALTETDLWSDQAAEKAAESRYRTDACAPGGLAGWRAARMLQGSRVVRALSGCRGLKRLTPQITFSTAALGRQDGDLVRAGRVDGVPIILKSARGGEVEGKATVLCHRLARAGCPFFSMAYIVQHEGPDVHIVREFSRATLSEFLARTQPTEAQLMSIACQAFMSIIIMARHGLVNNDLYPRNVLIDDDVPETAVIVLHDARTGRTWALRTRGVLARITDFGVAELHGAKGRVECDAPPPRHVLCPLAPADPQFLQHVAMREQILFQDLPPFCRDLCALFAPIVRDSRLPPTFLSWVGAARDAVHQRLRARGVRFDASDLTALHGLCFSAPFLARAGVDAPAFLAPLPPALPSDTYVY